MKKVEAQRLKRGRHADREGGGVIEEIFSIARARENKVEIEQKREEGWANKVVRENKERREEVVT